MGMLMRYMVAVIPVRTANIVPRSACLMMKMLIGESRRVVLVLGGSNLIGNGGAAVMVLLARHDLVGNGRSARVMMLSSRPMEAIGADRWGMVQVLHSRRSRKIVVHLRCCHLVRRSREMVRRGRHVMRRGRHVMRRSRHVVSSTAPHAVSTASTAAMSMISPSRTCAA